MLYSHPRGLPDSGGGTGRANPDPNKRRPSESSGPSTAPRRPNGVANGFPGSDNSKLRRDTRDIISRPSPVRSNVYRRDDRVMKDRRERKPSDHTLDRQRSGSRSGDRYAPRPYDHDSSCYDETNADNRTPWKYENTKRVDLRRPSRDLRDKSDSRPDIRDRSDSRSDNRSDSRLETRFDNRADSRPESWSNSKSDIRPELRLDGRQRSNSRVVDDVRPISPLGKPAEAQVSALPAKENGEARLEKIVPIELGKKELRRLTAKKIPKRIPAETDTEPVSPRALVSPRASVSPSAPASPKVDASVSPRAGPVLSLELSVSTESGDVKEESPKDAAVEEPAAVTEPAAIAEPAAVEEPNVQVPVDAVMEEEESEEIEVSDKIAEEVLPTVGFAAEPEDTEMGDAIESDVLTKVAAANDDVDMRPTKQETVQSIHEYLACFPTWTENVVNSDIVVKAEMRDPESTDPEIALLPQELRDRELVSKGLDELIASGVTPATNKVKKTWSMSPPSALTAAILALKCETMETEIEKRRLYFDVEHKIWQKQVMKLDAEVEQRRLEKEQRLQQHHLEFQNQKKQRQGSSIGKSGSGANRRFRDEDDTGVNGMGQSGAVNNSRRSRDRHRRAHGDVVRSEGEFLEILASLEQQTARDPLVRARLTSARIPDQCQTTQEVYNSTNSLVTDHSTLRVRLSRDGVDNFTPEEHAKFLDAYVLYPKQFGMISDSVGRTFNDCVMHYYRTKKEYEYKKILAQKLKRKRGRKPRKPSEEEEVGPASPETVAEAAPETVAVEADPKDEVLPVVMPPMVMPSSAVVLPAVMPPSTVTVEIPHNVHPPVLPMGGSVPISISSLLDRPQWSAAEEEQLESLVKMHGSDMSSIAAALRKTEAEVALYIQARGRIYQIMVKDVDSEKISKSQQKTPMAQQLPQLQVGIPPVVQPIDRAIDQPVQPVDQAAGLIKSESANQQTEQPSVVYQQIPNVNAYPREPPAARKRSNNRHRRQNDTPVEMPMQMANQQYVERERHASYSPQMLAPPQGPQPQMQQIYYHPKYQQYPVQMIQVQQQQQYGYTFGADPRVQHPMRHPTQQQQHEYHVPPSLQSPQPQPVAVQHLSQPVVQHTERHASKSVRGIYLPTNYVPRHLLPATPMPVLPLSPANRMMPYHTTFDSSIFSGFKESNERRH